MWYSSIGYSNLQNHPIMDVMIRYDMKEWCFTLDPLTIWNIKIYVQRKKIPRIPLSAQYLSDILQQRAQVLVVRLGVGGRGPAVLQLCLELQEAAHVVGLLLGWLLQQRLLIGFSILSYFTLGGVSLSKGLRRNEEHRTSFITLILSFYFKSSSRFFICKINKTPTGTISTKKYIHTHIYIYSIYICIDRTGEWQ